MPALRKIKRKDLDINKYSEALNSAVNYRIYAEAEYLDALTGGKWECLIFGDYEAIMPLPLQFKLGFKFVAQPYYCQQLGVFYANEISEELFGKFQEALQLYRVRDYRFNEENTERFQPEGKKMANQILDLNKPYELLKKAYSKSTKWNLRQFEKSENTVEFGFDDMEKLMEFKELHGHGKFPKQTLLNMMKITEKKGILETATVSEGGEMLAYGSFLISSNRIIYINSTASEKGKETGAPTGILDEIIRKYSDKALFLDFEGSSIPALNDFFRRFGAEEKHYIRYANFR